MHRTIRRRSHLSSTRSPTRPLSRPQRPHQHTCLCIHMAMVNQAGSRGRLGTQRSRTSFRPLYTGYEPHGETKGERTTHNIVFEAEDTERCDAGYDVAIDSCCGWQWLRERVLVCVVGQAGGESVEDTESGVFSGEAFVVEDNESCTQQILGTGCIMHLMVAIDS